MTKISFLATFLSLFLVFSAQAQEKPDSVTVSYEALKNLQKEHKELKRRVILQDSMISEQERQIGLWKNRAEQDSIIAKLVEKRSKIIHERLKLRDDQIENLKQDNFWLRIRSYVFTAGGVLIGIVIGGA